MKTLAKLIRYHRYLVDEKRREVKELEERAVALEQNIDRLDAQVVAERTSAGETDLGSADYGGFAQASLVRRAGLIGELSEAADAVEESRNGLLDAFAELKRYEISLDRKEALARQSRAQRDQLELDEVSLNGHRRSSSAP
jgi:flagellar protein FliJ